MSSTALAPRDAVTESEADPFDLDVTVIPEVGADRMPVACGTSDGCGSTCASACASAV